MGASVLMDTFLVFNVLTAYEIIIYVLYGYEIQDTKIKYLLLYDESGNYFEPGNIYIFYSWSFLKFSLRWLTDYFQI